MRFEVDFNLFSPIKLCTGKHLYTYIYIYRFTVSVPPARILFRSCKLPFWLSLKDFDPWLTSLQTSWILSFRCLATEACCDLALQNKHSREWHFLKPTLSRFGSWRPLWRQNQVARKVKHGQKTTHRPPWISFRMKPSFRFRSIKGSFSSACHWSANFKRLAAPCAQRIVGIFPKQRIHTNISLNYLCKTVLWRQWIMKEERRGEVKRGYEERRGKE